MLADKDDLYSSITTFTQVEDLSTPAFNAHISAVGRSLTKIAELSLKVGHVSVIKPSMGYIYCT